MASSARAATVRQLLRPTVRAVSWAPLAAGAGLGLLVAALPAALVELEPDGWANVLRLAALAAAAGAAFVLDDPADPSTRVVPTSRLLRRTIRVTLLLPLVALWWAVVLLILRSSGALVDLPVGGLTIEAGALLAIAIAVAAVAGGTGDGGVTGAVATVTAGLLARLEQVGLVLDPSDPQWDRAHTRWALLATTALVAFVATGRDADTHRLMRATLLHRAKRPDFQGTSQS